MVLRGKRTAVLKENRTVEMVLKESRLVETVLEPEPLEPEMEPEVGQRERHRRGHHRRCRTLVRTVALATVTPLDSGD